jgi:hypothetical protein
MFNISLVGQKYGTLRYMYIVSLTPKSEKSITIIILNIIDRPVFYLKHEVSRTEFGFCLQTLAGSIMSRIVIVTYINTQSSQTYG